VLSVLLALVLHSGSRRRVLLVGTVFLAVTAGMYGLYLVGIYGALSYAGGLAWIRRGVAVVVGTLGALQLRDALAPPEERTLGVPRRARPGLFRRMRGLTVDERPLPVLLGSTAGLAVAVSLLETPCTLGLPVLWTDLVSRSDVGTAGAVLLTLVYLTVFLVDELMVFAVVVTTMRAVRLQERHGRALKLVSGVVMLTLAVVMLVRPSLLEDLGGTLAVFAGAALLAAGAVVVDRRHRRGTGGSDTASEASGLRG
jgi:cytochrome c biogenesis protein CcdA